MGNDSWLEGMTRVCMVLPPVPVDGGVCAPVGPNVKTAEAPAASVSIFLRVYPTEWLINRPSPANQVSTCCAWRRASHTHNPPHSPANGTIINATRPNPAPIVVKPADNQPLAASPPR
ncbi:hypothetical protein D3C84_523420 [compost metagenome]